ncbi:unnamed protein product [Nezara viridula]|uniref:Uncharacterized protein n=1 Tax=Nezara viridula TaxID=85310 RepID=A0A9P0H8S2_NEZVI|nr:unnamed protein product [Nezara viridula]
MAEEQIIIETNEEAIPEEYSEAEEASRTKIEKDAEAANQPEEMKPQKFMAVDLPFKDDQGNEKMRRITVPIIRELKERKYKIIKRKRTVPRKKKNERDEEEDTEEEYDACMLVETVTKTVLIRDVLESGDVEEREEDFKEEYLIGKERKFKYVTVEKEDENGATHEVEELEVESEIEDEKAHRRRRRIRKRIVKNRYNSEHELIGEEFKSEWIDEEEGMVREEFSHIEEEQPKEPKVEEEEKEHVIMLEDEEWKAIDELMMEGEEESIEEESEKEKIPRETSRDRERKKQKVSFYKLMKLFLNEIERRKVLMRDIKLFCHLTQAQVKSPGKEFEENPQKFIDQETAEVEALTKHLIEVYEQYKEEESRYQKEIDEVSQSEKKHLQDYKRLLLDLIHDSDKNVMKRLSKGQDLTKVVEDTFKYEELLSKEYVKKAICTMNIEQIKYLLFTEVDQSDVPDEQKQVDPFELDKMMKGLRNFENEALEDRTKLEVEKKKFNKILENIICKRREADYMVRKEEEFLKKKPKIEKRLDEKEKLYWKLKKYWKDWEEAFQRSLKDDYKERFPAVYHNQKKLDAKGLSLGEMLNTLKQHCPTIIKKKKVPENVSVTPDDEEF